MRPAFGDWRSLVAHFVRDEGVGGSNPLSPTKFEKPAQRAGFFASVPMRMRTSGGREVRPERSERTLRQQRPAGRATQWRVIAITDQIRKACSTSRLFCICANEDENLRGQGGSTRAKRENVASATARRASHAVASNRYHRPNLKSLLNEQAFLHLWFCSPGKQSAAGVVILNRISPSPWPSPQRGEGIVRARIFVGIPQPSRERGKTNAACLPGVLESGRYPPFYAGAHGTDLLAPWREG